MRSRSNGAPSDKIGSELFKKGNKFKQSGETRDARKEEAYDMIFLRCIVPHTTRSSSVTRQGTLLFSYENEGTSQPRRRVFIVMNMSRRLTHECQHAFNNLKRRRAMPAGKCLLATSTDSGGENTVRADGQLNRRSLLPLAESFDGCGSFHRW